MMKIIKLVIYGFGKHSDVTVSLAEGINVLYGGNEAGKTTMRQFILHTLFGFPQRNADLLRYEPKAGGAYGGQLHIEDPEFGPCVIERVAGRSAGEVTVRFSDGRTGGEEALSILLRGHDRQSFESIFSFSLLQLQEIGRMNEEELGRALIASGTTGADNLAALETRMQKEAESLFKRSGRVPKMNVLVAELREMENELAQYRNKADGYAPMKERSAEARRRLDEISREMMEREERRRTLGVLRQALPLQSAKRSIGEELAQIGEAPFPQDGIRRYEAAKDRVLAAKAAISTIKERITKIQTAMPDALDEKRLTRVTSVLAEEADWHEARSTVRRAKEAIDDLEEERRNLAGRIGLGEDAAARLSDADASLQKEEELHRLTGRHQQALDKQRIVDDRVAGREAEAHRLAERAEQLAQSGPDDGEVDLAAKWPEIRRELTRAEAKKGTEQTGKTSVFLLIGLGALLSLLAVFTRQWLLLPAGLLIVAVAYLLRGRSGEGGLNSEEEKLLARFGGREEEMERLADRVRRHFAELDRLAEEEDRMRQEVGALKKEQAQAERDRSAMERELIGFVAHYGVKGLPSPSLVPEMFRLIREAQEAARRQEAEARRLEVAAGRMEDIRGRIQQILGSRVNDEMLFSRLRDVSDELLANRTARVRLHKEQDRLQEELNEQEVLHESLTEEIRRLFGEAGVEDESAYYEAAERAARRAELQKEFLSVERQLESIGGPFDGTPDETEILARLEQQEKMLRALAEERDRLMEERADIEAQMAHLLTDRAYDEQLQLFEMKKAEFRRLAREWAARKAAGNAIARTVGRMKEEKLPDAINQASRLFNRLTGGAQAGLHLNLDGRFEAESRNGVRFGIHELSQATKEQAYIALRLALAESLKAKAPFPIIMDDPFVHFDRERLGHMIELMEEWKKDHQFLYFTCHDDMCTAFTDASIIDVAGAGSGKDVLTR
ncbi:AAA family ATPase [Bhargavaea ullalensis]|uniref:Uncharacterized protein YhaN n=1 Tax=Bhargavaea ullalensis TaxID=1265685 RepID=A0ABV2GE38_9BACL